ncbi:MAG: NADP-dependent oxidoreductase [Balneolales bacterium]|nr:NADP-dependent oxidoreductase [Balneolales bacterium]
MSTKMKAAYYEAFGSPEEKPVKVGELPKPSAGEGEVLIRVKGAGVNPVDAYTVRGMLKDAFPCKFPLIPGWDVAGVVEETGHAARRFKKGDAVFAYARRPEIQHGTFAEYISLSEAYVAAAPASVSIEEAAGIPLVGLTAWQSLFDAGKLEAGQTVLIIGASGGVGSVAIQLAKNAGAKVIAVASSANHAFMQELGADACIDYHTADIAVDIEKAAGGPLDLIYDCSRGDVLTKTHQLLKQGGYLVSITNSKPERRDDVKFQYVFVEPNAPQLEELARLTDAGKLKIHVSKTYPLNEAADALQQIETLHTKGKIVIRM